MSSIFSNICLLAVWKNITHEIYNLSIYLWKQVLLQVNWSCFKIFFRLEHFMENKSITDNVFFFSWMSAACWNRFLGKCFGSIGPSCHEEVRTKICGGALKAEMLYGCCSGNHIWKCGSWCVTEELFLRLCVIPLRRLGSGKSLRSRV